MTLSLVILSPPPVILRRKPYPAGILIRMARLRLANDSSKNLIKILYVILRPSACQRLKQESNKNPLRHPEETQCPKDLRVSKEIFARDVGEATNIILKPYCVSSGVSGRCPDGIRLEIFKRCNENLLCRSEQKFSLQSFKISFNSAGFSFLWFISFLLPAQSKRKEMNIIESHFEHSSYLKQESTCQIKHSKLL